MRPNVLFLMSDQHRADLAGYAGNEVIRTPTLDRLAETGTVFTNAYTPSPVCVPARQCLMSGQLPKTCGCEGWYDLAPGYRTFARDFTRHAYTTVAAGKLHHLGTDQMQGWRSRIAPDAEISDAYIEGKIEAEFERYRPAPGTGKWSNQRELEEARVVDGPYQKFDARVHRATIDFIDRYFDDHAYRRPGFRPLLLKMSVLQPHYPFFTNQEQWDYYYDRVPVFTEEPCDHPVLGLSQQNAPVHASEETIRRATTAYYGMTTTVDSYFGSVLSRLEALGEDLDDWIIIYTSDHGEMLGQHGIWEKTRFYEGSVRVPLIIRWPKRFAGGRIVEQNVNLCDIYATLCDLAGLPIPAGLDSRSLVPLLDGRIESWNNESVSQFLSDHVMIKQDDLKYQYYGPDVPEVLFDLAIDSEERENLINETNYADEIARFRRRLAELGHGPNAERNYVNAGY